ncbi:MAG: hypothetical protein AVDCRST_MAG49-3918, partial [uncultured Thermomicrobiales bacterium]
WRRTRGGARRASTGTRAGTARRTPRRRP